MHSMKLICLICVVLILPTISIYFGGKQYSDKEWLRLKKTVKCWTEKGKWTLVNDYTYDSSLSHMQNYEKFAPCIRKNTKNLNYNDVCYNLPNSTAMNYVWQANDCETPLVPFSADSWCKLSDQLRNILLIGDSMTALYTGVTLMDELARSSGDHSVCMNINPVGSKFSLHCPLTEGSTKHDLNITSVRNDKLSLITTHKTIGRTFEYPFVDKMSHASASLIVMNRGAHYVEDNEVINELNTTLRKLYTMFPQLSIIYRNTPYGHNAGNGSAIYKEFFDAPLEKSQNASTILNMFNYNKFEHQNKLVEQLIEKEFPQIILLDAFTPTILRVDSHINYLHYCFGSTALSNWAKMIYNIILLVSKHNY